MQVTFPKGPAWSSMAARMDPEELRKKTELVGEIYRIAPAGYILSQLHEQGYTYLTIQDVTTKLKARMQRFLASDVGVHGVLDSLSCLCCVLKSVPVQQPAPVSVRENAGELATTNMHGRLSRQARSAACAHAAAAAAVLSGAVFCLDAHTHRKGICPEHVQEVQNMSRTCPVSTWRWTSRNHVQNVSQTYPARGRPNHVQFFWTILDGFWISLTPWPCTLHQGRNSESLRCLCTRGLHARLRLFVCV